MNPWILRNRRVPSFPSRRRFCMPGGPKPQRREPWGLWGLAVPASTTLNLTTRFSRQTGSSMPGQKIKKTSCRRQELGSTRPTRLNKHRQRNQRQIGQHRTAKLYHRQLSRHRCSSSLSRSAVSSWMHMAKSAIAARGYAPTTSPSPRNAISGLPSPCANSNSA